MSSTTATSLGAAVATGRAGTSGNSRGEGEGGFLAAMGAAQPAARPAAPSGKGSEPSQGQVEAANEVDSDAAADVADADADAGTEAGPVAAKGREQEDDAATDATDAAAIAAAVLAATPQPPAEGESPEASGDDAALEPAAMQARQLPSAMLAALRDALAARQGNAPETDGALPDAAEAAAGNGARGANGFVISQAGLRQVLQLMGQQPGASHLDGAAMDMPAVAAQAQPGSTSNARKLLQGMSELLAARTQSAAAGEPSPLPPPASASAPNSMLAAAATNFGSPLPQPAPATAAPSQTLHSAVGTARWAEELGSRLTLMSLRGQHEGSLTLTPEHLGPLEVRISVSHNTANVWFGAQHADARAALAEAMPRLRELFGNAGLTLGQSSVSQQAPRQGSRDGETPRVGATQAAGVDVVETTAPATRRVLLGLVDTYV